MSDPSYLKDVLGTPPLAYGTGAQGSAVMMDSRLLHAGSANESHAKRRVLFYFSFQRCHPGNENKSEEEPCVRPFGSTYSMWEEDKGKFFLGQPPLP